MAKEDLDLDVEAAEPEKKSGGMKMIIIAVVGVPVLIGATLGALYFAGIIGGDESAAPVAESAPAAGAEGEAAKPGDKAVAGVAKGPMNYLPMEPAFVVNFGADADVRFMQINIQVGSRDSAALENVKVHTPAIRNGLVMLYSSQDPTVLNTRAGKEELLKQTREEINRVLKEQTGTSSIEQVYFTSFVMQ